MIQKINSDEFDKLPLCGRGRTSPLFNQIASMKPGEACIIPKKDWKPKYEPTRIVRNVGRKFGFKYKHGRLPDNTGWGVKRLS